MAATSAPTLLSLPTELLNEVISYLHVDADLYNVIRTCRRLYDVSAPKLYRRIELGYFGPSDSKRSPERALRVLKALANPDLARSVVFLDHVDSPLPDFTRASSKRPFDREAPEPVPVPVQFPIIVQQHAPLPVGVPAVPGDGEVPAAPPLPSPPPPPEPPKSKHRREELEKALDDAIANLDEAQIHTLRIVQGSDSLAHAMLQYAVRHECVRKLWIEDVPLRCLTHFLEVTPEIKEPDFTTGFTHLRLRKLKRMGSRRALIRGRYMPNDDCVHRFLGIILPHSPHLTSLALDAMQNLENLPALLEPLTLPALQAFQLRSQIEDGCIAPYYLTNPRILSFLLRHPNIKAFGWPAENFVPAEADIATLAPLMLQFSDKLEWFRADCSLLDFYTHDGRNRSEGTPKASRLFLATFLAAMKRLNTIKLQGDYLPDELTAIHEAIGFSPSSRKMTKYSLIRKKVELELLFGLVAAMPNLQILKLCAYFTPGLVSFYDVAPRGIQDGATNINLDEFLSYLTPLKELTTLTFPLHPGLDIADRVVSDIWDSYRERHPPSPNFNVHPHSKPMATEIDMSAPLPDGSTTVDSNGIEQKVLPDPDVVALHPPTVVNHLLSTLRRCKAFEKLETVRCFFILSLNNSALDITELMVDVEHRAAEAEESRLELKRSPVIAYGWGTGLWLGETKDLATRAWF